MRAICVAIAAAVPLLAEQPLFKSTVQLVTVPISVTSVKGDQLITRGVTIDDFRVFEDGVEQPVRILTQDRQPTSLCIVVDASGSMAEGRRYQLGLSALRQTVLDLAQGDEVAILRFSNTTTVQMPWTKNPEASKVTWKLDAGAGSLVNSSITDAVRRALRLIDEASNPRRLVLVISDGYENSSMTPLDRVVKTREQSETQIYAYGLGGPVELAPGGGRLRNILPYVVGDSGGVLLNVSSPDDARNAANTLLAELNYQFMLGYESTRPMDGKYRRVKVEITVPNLAVRHRGGYLAVPSVQAPGPKPQAP